jgi:hypothetical protein
MKIAHLILAHAQPSLLESLVKKLSHADADFYIHIDAGKNAAEFNVMQSVPNVFYIKKRVNITWGAYSIVQAILNAFEEIVASGSSYGYINLLSGQDYPLKETSFIHQYFALHHGKQFMEFYSVYDSWQEAIPHITKYHLINYNVPFKYQLQGVINKLMPSRRMPKKLEPVGKSMWFSITLPAVKYIISYLQDYPEVTRFFKLTWAPDRFIFQTILYNSVFRSDMVNNNLRCKDVRETNQSCKIPVIKDLFVPDHLDCLFTRKIDFHTTEEPIDAIDVFTDYKVSA